MSWDGGDGESASTLSSLPPRVHRERCASTSRARCIPDSESMRCGAILRVLVPLSRVLWGEFPDLSGTIRRLRLLAPRRTSLRFLRSALPPLRPLRSPGGGRFPEGLDHFSRGARTASSRWRGRDIPGSWTTLAYMPRSQTPADRRTQATTGPAMWSSADLMTSTPHRTLSRLNHAACTLSVYASQPGSPPDHATLDSGWWPTLTGQGSHLLGRIEGFRHVRPSTWLPPSPSFAWRNKSLFLRRSRRYPNTNAHQRGSTPYRSTRAMTAIGVWVQAISAATIAALTLWLVVFSDVGDLAMALLNAELLELREEIQAVNREKQQLQVRRQSLEAERVKLRTRQSQHLEHITNALLRDLWLIGVRRLSAYKRLAETSQELQTIARHTLALKEADVTEDTTLHPSMWHHDLPTPEDMPEESRSEWGELLIDWSGFWDCSMSIDYVYEAPTETEFDAQGTRGGTAERAKLVGEWMDRKNEEYRRRTIEYNLTCFSELEEAIRVRIERVEGQGPMVLRDFAEQLLRSQGLDDVSEEILERIRGKLMSEVVANRQLGNLVLELRVSEGAPYADIAEEARRIVQNLHLARDWLDEATRDRRMWAR